MPRPAGRSAPRAGPDSRLLRDDVGLRDDTQDGAVLADDRDARDVTLGEQPGHVLDRPLRRDRDDVARHHVADLHAAILRVAPCGKPERESVAAPMAPGGSAATFLS
jgi:hypothetical protein